jgi:hypothetical protein
MILIQSLIDEFGIKGEMVRTPATSGQKLQVGEVEDELRHKEKKFNQASVGKKLYLER